MVVALRRLRREHAAIAEVLNVIERELDKLGAGAPPHPRTLELALRYCQDFPAVCHHPMEDLVYEKLRARHEVTEAAIDDLVAEHKKLANKGAGFLAAVQGLATDGDGAFPELIAAGRDFLAFYRRHMDQEERAFFPAALESLGDGDWAEIDARAEDRADPLFGAATEARFAELRDKILRLEQDGDAGRNDPAQTTRR